ncbi:MAG: hypothetical protein ABIH39_03370, partial [Candidatus Margulisiibacteriota bacterium]
GTLLNEIIAEMNRLDGTNPPAASWQDARYKTNYIISRWEQIDTYNTVQVEYVDTTGVFPSGVVEGGLYSEPRLKYKINSETDHSLGWEVYSKSSKGVRPASVGGSFSTYDSRLTQAYHQSGGLTMAQIRGTSAAAGDPYNTNWAVHAMGALSRQAEKSMAQNVSARVGNRARSKKYKKEMEKYREAVDEELYSEAIGEARAAKNEAQQKGALKKAENENNAARKKELNKAIQRIKEANKKQEAESKKAANKSAAGSKKKK